MARKATSTNVPHIPLGKRKRVLAASLASTDNVDPLAIKRRKHEAANASASAASAAASPAAATQQDPIFLIYMQFLIRNANSSIFAPLDGRRNGLRQRAILLRPNLNRVIHIWVMITMKPIQKR